MKARNLTEWISQLIRTDFNGMGRIMRIGLRIAWRHRTRPVETGKKETIPEPTGPFAETRRQQTGDLLLWVPRKIESFLIDDLTGAYGYSHVTIDTGESDSPTGKPVMIEAMVGRPVERQFQDSYGSRPYVRVPLSKTGADSNAFVACVKSRLGEAYDDLEALTLGEVDDPAKQMCSSLASDCLPENSRRKISLAQRMGLIRRPAVSVNSQKDAPDVKVFISPNGFAEYFGAPEGKEIHDPDTKVELQPGIFSGESNLRKKNWKSRLAVWAFASAILIIAIRKIYRSSIKWIGQG